MQYFFKDHFKWRFIAVIAFSLVAAFLAYHEMPLSLKIILVIYLTLSLGLCTTADDLGIERVVIKGVSDYAGDNKSDGDPWRLFCSLMAVSLVAHVLSAFDVFQEWRHYEEKCS